MDNMKFILGCEIVTAINDGGLGIRYNIGKGYTDFRPFGGIRPVLSLEAKRRKSKRRDDPELVWEHAGQIFAEMLGQVCHKDFYENHDMEYQEVSLYLLRSSLTCLCILGVRNSWQSFIDHNLLLQISQRISFANFAIRQEFSD